MVVMICLYKHLIEIMILIFLLRLWIYFSVNNYYNFFVKFIISLTNIFLKYIQKVIFIKNRNEILSKIIILILLFFKYPLLILVQDKNLFFRIFGLYIFVSILTFLKFFGYLFFWLITIYLISNIFRIQNNNFNDLLDIFINQIGNITKLFFLNIDNISIFLFIINIILYFLNNIFMNLFSQFWFLI
ncbi:hypothetical protein GJU02_01385 [Enterobacteriaceae endosymbiont of Donacia thalassina]|uniref:hypothetical protein n=1 Tax=Enterobacteriaceae endosymbiont of Donacia thalassina TaxID=2675786 RepID=UPI001448D1A4|nr:hypothetical protein [Enterobacteriaceae endosymbiont of Donacia thalassina]QJC37387.1 hypothetical protein GJU02_01385 [Enterobacteriaceae endosymbiont of Donacia thalassina]